MNINKKDKCRTCLQTSSKMQLLNSMPTKRLKAVDKTYEELLEDLTQIKIQTDKQIEMPQVICRLCSRKLRESYSFIKQVQKCNEILMTSSSTEDEHCIAGNGMVEFIENDGNCTSRSSTSDDNMLANTLELNETHLPAKSRFSTEVVKFEAEEQGNIFQECIISEDDISSDEDKPLNTEDETYDPIKGEPSKNSLEDKTKRISCDECNRVFTKILLLNRHRKDCHPPSRIKLQCPECPAQFNRRHNMNAHINKFHESNTSELKSHEVFTKKKEIYACGYCEKSYHTKYKLIAHVKNKHEPENNHTKDKQPEKRFLCTLCGLAFNSESNLDIHYRRHTGERPFKCDLCDRSYPRLYEVQIHRRSHTGEKPYKCSVCEKGFITNHKLKVHMRTHTNERPYKCTQCEKAFKQSKDLNIHKRSHTGEKPYKCGVCNSTFTQTNSLKMHQTKTKHTDDLEKIDVQSWQKI